MAIKRAAPIVAKILPLIIEALVIWLAVTPIHEYWHVLAANWCGSSAHATFGFLSGHFYYSGALLQWQDTIVWLAGGLGTALIFGLLWVCAWWQGKYTEWEIDEVWMFSVVTIQQLLYGFAEGLHHWANLCAVWYYAVIGIVTMAIVLWLYGRRLMQWLGLC